MLNNFICVGSFFLRVSDWKLFNIGTFSNHSAVQVKFQITAIKFKVKENIKSQVDCTTIGENMETNDLFNVNLYQLLPKDPTSTQFNQYITKASVIDAVTTEHKNKD